MFKINIEFMLSKSFSFCSTIECLQGKIMEIEIHNLTFYNDDSIKASSIRKHRTCCNKHLEHIFASSIIIKRKVCRKFPSNILWYFMWRQHFDLWIERFRWTIWFEMKLHFLKSFWHCRGECNSFVKSFYVGKMFFRNLSSKINDLCSAMLMPMMNNLFYYTPSCLFLVQ